MQILLNGEQAEFEAGLTIDALMARLEVNPRKVAVERNREIVPKSEYASVSLAEADEIEIVAFIGGG